MNLKSKIALGTAQFGLDYGVSNKKGKTSTYQVKSILDYAIYEGIDTIDTAPSYGSAEKSLGHIGVDKFKVVSKSMPVLCRSKSIREQLSQTLNDLGLTSIYGYLSHRPKTILKYPKNWDTLLELKHSGIVKKIGLSLYSPDVLRNLLTKNIVPDIVQVPLNYLDNRFEDLLERLYSQGCEIHTRSTFLQGLFFVDPDSLPEHFNSIKLLLKNLRDLDDRLPGELLSYVLNKPYVNKVIIGVESKEQLVENISTVGQKCSLPPSSMQLDEKILNPSKWPIN